MSDGKEVKRFYFVPTGEKDVFGSPTFVCHDKSLNGDDWFMPVEDHDRIVAELRAEVERLKGKTPTRIRFDGTRFKKVKDRFERAFSQLNRPNDTDEQFLISSVESLLLDVGELEARVLHDITYRDETIATQARVIEKLRAALEWYANATEFEISGDEIGEPLADGVPFTTVAKSILKEIEQGEGT